MANYSDNGPNDGRARHGNNDLVWGKGFRRVPLDGRKPMTMSQEFAGPRLFVKHYPDGRADEYVYADAEPARIKLPVIIVSGAFCSVIVPILGRSAYISFMDAEAPVSYISDLVILAAFLIILVVLTVKYMKEKDVFYEEMPAGADPREKGKNYSGNVPGKTVQRETPVYYEQFASKRIFSSVCLILLIILMLAGITSLALGYGMHIAPEDDNGFGVFFMALGGFWIIMSLVGIISSVTSLANAKKMKKRFPPPPAEKKQDNKTSVETVSDDDEDYIRMKRKGFE